MAERTQISLRVEGMTCDGCTRHVTRALEGVPGVEEARVPTWQMGQATVLAEEAVADEALTRAVEEAGYRALILERRPVEGERRFPSTGGDYDLMVIRECPDGGRPPLRLDGPPSCDIHGPGHRQCGAD